MTVATVTAPGIDELALPNHPETKVWLKQRPTWGDKNRVQAHATVSRREVAPGKFETDPEGFADWLVIKVLVMLHDWTVTDEAGRKLPISAEALESLDPEDGEFVAAEAGRRYSGDTAPLATNSEPSSATESTSPIPAQSESPDSEN